METYDKAAQAAARLEELAYGNIYILDTCDEALKLELRRSFLVPDLNPYVITDEAVRDYIVSCAWSHKPPVATPEMLAARDIIVLDADYGLAGKPATQEIFTYILRALISEDKRVFLFGREHDKVFPAFRGEHWDLWVHWIEI